MVALAEKGSADPLGVQIICEPPQFHEGLQIGTPWLPRWNSE